MSRPAVTVIVPFAGPRSGLAALGGALGRVALAAGDEILIADNTPAAGPVQLPGGVTVIAAGGTRAPGYARNCAAAQVRTPWLVMLDADTTPGPGLLDAYFSPAPRPRTAVLAGGIDDTPQGSGPASTHASRRGQMHERATLHRTGRPYAQTANCAVRTDAFRSVGGFDETARWGEDADLCFRLFAAGWRLEPRPEARVGHLSRGSLVQLLAQLSGHGAGAAWLQRRYPGEFTAPQAGELVRRAGSGVRRALAGGAHGDRETARMAGLELLEMAAFETGRLRSNTPRRG